MVREEDQAQNLRECQPPLSAVAERSRDPPVSVPGLVGLKPAGQASQRENGQIGGSDPEAVHPLADSFLLREGQSLSCEGF